MLLLLSQAEVQGKNQDGSIQLHTRSSKFGKVRERSWSMSCIWQGPRAPPLRAVGVLIVGCNVRSSRQHAGKALEDGGYSTAMQCKAPRSCLRPDFPHWAGCWYALLWSMP